MEKMKVNDNTYELVKLLGKGKGGYSYLVRAGEKQYVLKQIHHEPCEYYQFGNKLESELKDYKSLTTVGVRMPVMLEIDMEQERILKQYIEGDTIDLLVAEDRMKPEYFQQIYDICKLLYKNKMNIDYFPTNFVVQEELLYYIDYECNDYLEEWNFENWGIKYWSKTEEFLDHFGKHQEGD
jgi:tRNA A-37 threonylcarbamoyl transferase component Bud32